MRSRTAIFVFVLTAAMLVTHAGSAAADGGRRLSATLTGTAEVPGPGDADGTGTASITVNPGHRRVCFRLTVAGITLSAVAAHIHQAPAGVVGPVVVTLTPPGVTGTSSGCVGGLSRSLLMGLIHNPSAYYVNVHTVDLPNGAVRGQLGRGFTPTTGQSTLSASLRGSSEVPFPGDPDGRGSASLTLNPSLGTICFRLTASGIALPATAALIYQGGFGVVGPGVVTLIPPGFGGSSSGCVGGLTAALINGIIQNPSGYYVNVHTVDFPNGAVRGQLQRGGDDEGDDDDDQGDDDDDGDGD